MPTSLSSILGTTFKGDTGPQGFSGISGFSGVSGFSGRSGFSGTEALWISVNSNYSAANKDRLVANTSNGFFVITLPASPSAGDFIKIADGFNFSANNLNVARNSATIENMAEDLTLDVGGCIVELLYDGTTWQVYGVTSTITSNVLTNDSVSIVTNKTLVDPVITGAVVEDVFTIQDAPAFEVNPSNGTIQLVTLTANRTPKANNFLAGESVTLMVDDGTLGNTITWTDSTWGTNGVSWVNNSAPTLSTSGYTVIEFWKVGTQIYGAVVGVVL